MKSKILLSVLVIVFAVSMVVGGTMAYFSDTETVVGNTFAAGKLDLEIGANTTPFAVSNVVPGQSGTKIISLTNTTGSVAGTLNVNLANIVQLENEITEPEVGLNGEYTPNSGELGMFLNFIAYIDVDKNESFNSGDIQLAYNGVLPYSQINYFAGWKTTNPLLSWTDIMNMNGGQSVNLVIMWAFPTESQDQNYSQNIAMTDSLSFDIVVVLNQTH